MKEPMTVRARSAASSLGGNRRLRVIAGATALRTRGAGDHRGGHHLRFRGAPDASVPAQRCGFRMTPSPQLPGLDSNQQPSG
jgi:hypothetical protein